MTGFSLKEIADRFRAGIYQHSDLVSAIGNINSPLLDMPLKNSLAMKVGVGSTTFTRASTATYIDRYGMLKTASIDEPRFEKEGYLNEGASTNLLTYSEQFDTSWAKANLLLETNTLETTDPYGTNLACKITKTGPSGRIQQDFITTASSHTFSIFVKAGTSDTVTIRLTKSTTEIIVTAIFTFSTKTSSVISETGSIIHEELQDGWYRLKITGAVADTTLRCIIYPYNYTTGDTGTVYIFGAQLEAMPFATSYIPTTSATVTRSADMLYVTRANNFPDAQSNAEGFSVAYDMNSIGQNSATSQQFAWSMYVTSTDTIGAIVFGTSAIRQIVISSSANTINSYSTTNFKKRRVISTASNSILKLYIDGVLGDTDTNTTGRLTDTANSLTNIRIGGVSTGTSSNFNGHISNFRIYDKALSAQEVALA